MQFAGKMQVGKVLIPLRKLWRDFKDDDFEDGHFKDDLTMFSFFPVRWYK